MTQAIVDISLDYCEWLLNTLGWLAYFNLEHLEFIIDARTSTSIITCYNSIFVTTLLENFGSLDWFYLSNSISNSEVRSWCEMYRASFENPSRCSRSFRLVKSRAVMMAEDWVVQSCSATNLLVKICRRF
jgi:hypothetical protein